MSSIPCRLVRPWSGGWLVGGLLNFGQWTVLLEPLPGFLERDPRRRQIAARGRDVAVAEPVARFMSWGTGLQHPGRELTTEIVKPQAGDPRTSAGVPPSLPNRLRPLPHFVPEHERLRRMLVARGCLTTMRRHLAADRDSQPECGAVRQ